jgi:hypothetical protein
MQRPLYSFAKPLKADDRYEEVLVAHPFTFSA